MSKNEMAEDEFARDTLERYSASPASKFQSNLLLTDSPRYVRCFAEKYGVAVYEGTLFNVAHHPTEELSILDFKTGLPAAALAVDLCSFLDVKAALFLGMCGGLRKRYKIGEYLVPVASIRADRTSDGYFPSEVPALSNFLMQKAVTDVLEKKHVDYHIGMTYTTSRRFWEHHEEFIAHLKTTRAQAIELECATLFTGSYKRRLTLGALLLISDLPLDRDRVRTKESSEKIFRNFMVDHLDKGIEAVKRGRKMQSRKMKGAYHRNIGM
ncbi:MAG: AMP nucleosidase [Chlamydiota bacterium]